MTSRRDISDKRRYLADLRDGVLPLGWGPQTLVLGPLPPEVIRALCEQIEALSAHLEPVEPVQFRAEIERFARYQHARDPALHVRLCDAIANLATQDLPRAAALILATIEGSR
jgi:hypothetical protein